MIIVETLDNGLIHTFSNRNLKIMQETGLVYDDAIDIPTSGHYYTETDIPIQQPEEPADEGMPIEPHEPDAPDQE